ncbi:hypothetical protein BLL42_21425 [Pseudomonas frederiksbergensis]|uniref:Uncharacterized protein n=1 Tax=Pseudomonas frederiksbergensis TaxID=104087 RepID=A0A1J0EQ71_9PSED|nr:hypothetical protein [Pseudomonas frederiksbergensis]APC18158.1 hypothetical protein BLL42_21425 [Pseudomonas frederiksbergensis]
MTDYSELKKAAEYAQDFKSHADEAEEMRALSAFYDEVAPADVLALIAERDHLKAENAGLRGQAEVAQKGAGQLKVDLQTADTACFLSIAENKKLKFESEALRKDAERYRRMRAMTLKQIDDTPDEFDAEFDSQLGAAMSKEAPHG